MPVDALLGIGSLLLASAGVIVFVSDRAPAGDDQPPLRVLAWWWVPAAVAVIGMSIWTVATILIGIANSAPDPSDQASLRMEAVKTALTVGAGAAGAAAILLALRRQWLGERAQRHLEFDSTERRITELYAKASDQLGHDSPAVRLAGLYALERLGQLSPQHRQTVLDVLCAYIRLSSRERPVENEEVRLTAQRIVTAHLGWPNWASEPPRTFWADADLDLTGAYLDEFHLENCRVRSVSFDDATFHHAFVVRTVFSGEPWGTSGPTGVGGASFRRTTFSGRTVFEDVDFESDLSFQDALFADDTYLGGLSTKGEASFERATFAARLEVAGSEFGHGAKFDEVTFGGPVVFGPDVIYAVGVKSVDYGVTFTNAVFQSEVDFSGADFRGTVITGAGATDSGADFSGVVIGSGSPDSRVWPPGWRETDAAGGVITVERESFNKAT